MYVIMYVWYIRSYVWYIFCAVSAECIPQVVCVWLFLQSVFSIVARYIAIRLMLCNAYKIIMLA